MTDVRQKNEGAGVSKASNGKKLPVGSMLVWNGALIAVVLVLNYFYQRNGFDFTLKCIGSGSFALLGAINLMFALTHRVDNRRFYFQMAVGILFAFLGDVWIKFDFIAGAAAFALGHICFVIAYVSLQSMRPRDWIVSGAIFLPCLLFLLFYPLLRFDAPVFRWVCVVYALIISAMLGKSVGNFVCVRSMTNGIIMAASALFFFSDLMLLLDWFVGRWDWTANACMGTYYPAMCLLAFAMSFKMIRERKT